MKQAGVQVIYISCCINLRIGQIPVPFLDVHGSDYVLHTSYLLKVFPSTAVHSCILELQFPTLLSTGNVKYSVFVCVSLKTSAVEDFPSYHH